MVPSTGYDMFRDDVRRIYRDVGSQIDDNVIQDAYDAAPMGYRLKYVRLADYQTDVDLCQRVEHFIRQQFEWKSVLDSMDPERQESEAILARFDEWFEGTTEGLGPLKHGWLDIVLNKY